MIGSINGYEYDEETTILPDTTTEGPEQFECTQAGFFCNECKESYFCFPIGDGSFLAQKVEDCIANGKTCLESTGECTTGENIKCNDNVTSYKFDCHQPGMFPDPYDCKKYYICSQRYLGQPEEHSCKDNAYNPLTTLCNKKLVGSKCDPLLKPCQSAGEVGVIPGHPSMYYICLQVGKILSPQLFLCPNDEFFIDKRCVQPDTGLNESGKCKSSGLFYVESDCKNYTECAIAGEEPTSKSCPCGSKFYPEKGACDVIECS